MIDFTNNGFIHNDVLITNPTVSINGIDLIEPSYYGFESEYIGGGYSVWVKNFDNGTVVLSDIEDNFTMCFYNPNEYDSEDGKYYDEVLSISLEKGIPTVE